MKNNNIKAIIGGSLSTQYHPRYIIINTQTGEILDDAQGYGYKTAQKAYAAYSYKNQTPQSRKKSREKEKAIRTWCRHHKNFMQLMNETAFEIAKGSWGPEDKFNVTLVKKLLKDNGISDFPFSASDLLQYWKKH